MSFDPLSESITGKPAFPNHGRRGQNAEPFDAYVRRVVHPEDADTILGVVERLRTTYEAATAVVVAREAYVNDQAEEADVDAAIDTLARRLAFDEDRPPTGPT